MTSGTSGLAAFDRLMKEPVAVQEAIEDVWMKSGGTVAYEDTYAAFEHLITIARADAAVRVTDSYESAIRALRERAEAAERLNGELVAALREAMRSVDWFRRIALETTGDGGPRQFDPIAWADVKRHQRTARALLDRIGGRAEEADHD